MKNIILISIDNLRYDCIGYQPDKKELKKYDSLRLLETPNLDKLSEKSICFTQCISTNTYTTSAHASVLTGLYPPRHGVRAFFDTKLSRDIFTLAEVLRIYGYETVLSTDVLELFAPLDINRGFEHTIFLDDHYLFKFLEEKRDAKVFLFMHLFDVHEPYLMSKYEFRPGCNDDYYSEMKKMHDLFGIYSDVPEDRPYKLWGDFWEKAGKRDIEYALPMFVKGVSKFDRGRFKWIISCFEKTGMTDDCLLVIFSDHGEGRYHQNEPSFFLHAGGLFDNVIRVPLMILHKDITPAINDSLVSLVDIFPTIIRLATGERSEDILPYKPDGMDLLDGNKREFVYSETWTGGGKIPIIDLDGAKHERFVGDYRDTVPSSVHQRGIRTCNGKIVIRGRTDEEIDTDFLKLGNEEFLNNIYRYLFGREMDEEGYNHFLTELNCNSMTKRDVCAHLLETEEYQKQKAKPALMVFDLEKDPYENNPVVFPKDIFCKNGNSNKSLNAFLRSEDMLPMFNSFNDVLMSINAEVTDMSITEKINSVGANKINFSIDKIREIESGAVLTEKVFAENSDKKKTPTNPASPPSIC